MGTGGAPAGIGSRRRLLAAPDATEAPQAAFKGACARDFADFVEGDAPWTAARPPHPDPDFREGLRRRLWRMQVMARGDRGLVRH